MPAPICHHRKAEILLSPPLFLSSLPSQTMVAILKVTNSSLLFKFEHVYWIPLVYCAKPACCMTFPHDWGLCWMQMPCRVTDGVFVSSWAGASKHWHSTKWLSLSAHDPLNPSQSPRGRLGKKKKKPHWPLHALAWSNTLNLSPAFAHWRKSMKLYKMIPPTVCNLCFLLCNLWFLVARVLANEKKPECVAIWNLHAHPCPFFP